MFVPPQITVISFLFPPWVTLSKYTVMSFVQSQENLSLHPIEISIALGSNPSQSVRGFGEPAPFSQWASHTDHGAVGSPWTALGEAKSWCLISLVRLLGFLHLPLVFSAPLFLRRRVFYHITKQIRLFLKTKSHVHLLMRQNTFRS